MQTNIADMTGKVCIVTGANSGIGKAICVGLARMGATTVMACRDKERGENALLDIRGETGGATLDLMELDLAKFASVRAFAEAFKTKYDRLDVLVNNAAIVPTRRMITDDGNELQFQVNHLSPFLLTHLLLDRLKASAPSRIVNVSSTVHHNARINFDDIQGEHRYSGLRAYGQSKLANVLFTKELARRLDGTGVTVNALHPGGVRTRIFRHAPLPLKPIFILAGIIMLSPERGGDTALYLAASPELQNVTGKYFAKRKQKRVSKEADDPEIARRLWDLSAQLTGVDS